MSVTEDLISRKFNKYMLEHPDDVAPEQRIIELEEFVQEFKDHPSFGEYKMMINYLTGESLYKLGRYEEAMLIYGPIYQLKPTGLDALIAQRMAEILIKFDRKTEAIATIEEAIINQSPFHKLGILSWYVLNIEDAEARLQEFSDQIDLVKKDAGITIPSNFNSLSETILFLKKERQAAGWRYTDLMVKGRENSHAEKIESLKQFISSETVGYFKKMAEETLLSLQKSAVE